MTECGIKFAPSVRVSLRAGEAIQIINRHDDEVRRNAAALDSAFNIDLVQFSVNVEAGLPTFMPVKPHRSGLSDNDNYPFCQ